MNATVSLINAGLDVAINSAKLFISVANFAYCLGVVTGQAARATYNAGKATRQWMDDFIAKAEAPQANVEIPAPSTPVIPDFWEGEVETIPQAPSNTIVPFTMPRLLAPAVVAGYLAPGVDEGVEMMTDYTDLGIRELRQVAKDKGIAKYSRKSKAALVRELATV